MKKFLNLAALVAFALVAAGCPWYPQDNGYEVVFEDNFDTLSPTWQPSPFGTLLPPTVEGGTVTLTATTANGEAWGHIESTGPRSSTEPNYRDPVAFEEGYFEARLRYTDNEWAWPVFWLFSLHKQESWPGEDCARLTSEFDILEPGLNNRASEPHHPSHYYYGNLHRNTADGSADNRWCGQADTMRSIMREFPEVNLSDWHVWAARWTPDQICTYLDGTEIGCVEPFDSTAQPMTLAFTIDYQHLCENCGPKPAALEIEVDWVKVWQLA